MMSLQWEGGVVGKKIVKVRCNYKVSPVILAGGPGSTFVLALTLKV